ncbi:MAG: OmpA family protein [Prevotellaceae bacterium]|jgi:outer membrane protein OmpA-like peptidoglycan-associated protein|nr:OmpA family protein [Prevotellaceae bacterium]
MFCKKFMFFLLLAPVAGGLDAQEFAGEDIFPAFQEPVRYPAMTPDGKYLVFLAGTGTAATAYEAHRDSGAWTEPVPFEFINSLRAQGMEGAGGFSFNHDGTTLYFHAKMETGYSDVFFSRKTRQGWGAPQRLGKPVSMDADLSSPTVSSDNKTLFVLRTKPSGKKEEACKELLLFEKNRDGQWVGPKFLPREFNAGCQETPFFCADNTVLFFSSRRAGENGEGKKTDDSQYDLYAARRIDENNWFYPVYVAGPNTGGDDLSPMLDSSGDYFLFTARAKKSKRQPQKIYAAALPPEVRPAKTFVLSGAVTDLYSGQPVAAQITVQDAVTSVTKGVFQATDEGRYSIILTKGAFYKIDFSKDRYSHAFHHIDLAGNSGEWQETFDVALFDHVNLELNVYDNELFYPVSPTVLVSDSLTRQPLDPQRIARLSTGKYHCRLDIGRIYKIRLESENFKPSETSFDLRTDVVYNNFEKSLELQAARKPLTLRVTDSEGRSILPVTVEITNLNRDESNATLAGHGQDGAPVLSLRTNDAYELNVTKKGFTYFNAPLRFETARPETLDIIMDSLTVQAKMIFNNITFETNSAELNAASFAELSRILKFMNENPGIRIEIAAHTDDVGTSEHNVRLSNKRAASVVTFLTENNAAKERLQAKGYGKLQPLVPNDSAENRAKNRRVEIRIIDTTEPEP